MSLNCEFHPDGHGSSDYDQINDLNSHGIKMGSDLLWLLPSNPNVASLDVASIQQVPYFSSGYYGYTSSSLENWPVKEQVQISHVLHNPQSESDQTHTKTSTGYYSQPQYTSTGSSLSQITFGAGLPAVAKNSSVEFTTEPQVQWTNSDYLQIPLELTENEELQRFDCSIFASNSTGGIFSEDASFSSVNFNSDWALVDWSSNFNTCQRNPINFYHDQTLPIPTNSATPNPFFFQQNLQSCLGDSHGDMSSYHPYNSNYNLNAALNYYYSPVQDKDFSNIESITSQILPCLEPSSLISKTRSVCRKIPPQKSSIIDLAKSTVRSESGIKKKTEKRVGKRRGPLLPQQRKQASEIRKLRACLRCKFLKKTCDTGDPCAGCQPSHARLWQVPCTRVDIKDIAYFMKDWKADYESYVSRGCFNYQIGDLARKERLIWVTHGYGHSIPVLAQEILQADNSFFVVRWVEYVNGQPVEFSTETERIAAGPRGLSNGDLSTYLDNLLDSSFEIFIDEHFDGTPFLTELMMTAFRYYRKEKQPVIRKALKLFLAYNLTLQVIFVDKRGEERYMHGLINHEYSKYNGKIIAPIIIRYQIKFALANIWRNLQSEVLTELSALYSGVYSGGRIRNWPTIFMLASTLFATWEEIQFDSHYRISDPDAVHFFCNEMEAIPVPVIVGLFHAISQKLPVFTEWDTQRHGHILNNNLAVCEAMTEIKSHIIRHESYLRTRPGAQFDRRDFDSLANKFLSQLVIRKK
ncbi:hypothetical protein GcM3_006014 [Golovinomyces cichoracearum]|uniref:C6 finger domain-containing protein n=1 Tax=Golovinomyces cichoracearum TaxID=62708 RepID=A0A420JAU2_9PEZI|nr:hypothetical protein GcM3_006014 [Golovinomyces cichoracearum]